MKEVSVMKKSRFVSILFVLALFFVFVPTVSASAETKNAFDGTGYELFDNSKGNVYAFESIGNENYLVADSSVYKFEVSGGMLDIQSVSLGRGAKSAVFRKGSLYIFSSGTNGILMRECDLSSLVLHNKRTVDGNYSDVNQITADVDGNVYFTDMNSPCTLKISFSNGVNETLDFSDRVKCVLTYGEKVFVYAENKLMRYGVSGSALKLEREFDVQNIPTLMLSAGTYIDAGGNLFSLEENRAVCKVGSVTDYESSAGSRKAINFISDGNGGVVGAAASRTAIHVDKSGEADIRYTLNENIFAAGKNGAVTISGSKVSYYPFDTFTVRNEQSETKKDFPESWNVNGGFLMLEAGENVSSLISESGAEVYFDGEKVTSGKAKTGMIISLEEKSLTICVKGDINNSGTVNTEDLYLLEEYLIGSSELNEAQVLAGDMNGDESLDNSDLVLFRNAYLN